MPYTRTSYTRESITDTYSKQDPILFMKNEWGELQEDGSWIMKRSLILRKRSPIVKNGKFIVKIKRVDGDFNCAGQGLTTLEGGPEYVGGNYWCGCNKLKSLKHGPTYVGGLYSCADTNIKNLDYIPKELFGELDVAYTDIKTLEGGPLKIKGDLIIDGTKIKNLIGSPMGVDCIEADVCGLETLYGLTTYGINSIESDKLSGVEILFVRHMYSVEKLYKNYYNQLFKFSLDDYYNDIESVTNWPKGFLNKKRLNIISSLKSINKFKL